MREGWQEVQLQDAVRLHYGKALREPERMDGEVPVVGSAGRFATHNVGNARTSDGCIVVGRKGTAGSVTWFDGPAWVTDTAYWAEPLDGVGLQFAYLMLQNADLPSVTAQTGVPGLNRDRAGELPAVLPPLAEQRRIVDLIGAVDDAIEKAEAEHGAAMGAYGALADSLAASDWTLVRTGERADVLRGAVWTSADEVGAAADGYEEVVGIGVTGARGIDRSKMKFVAGLGERTHRLASSDLLLVGSNGNADRIGNVYDASELAGRPFSAFQLALRPKDKADARLLFHTLAAPATQAALTAATSGSTGLKNLGANRLRDLKLPVPPPPLRDRHVDILDRAQQVSASALSSVQQLSSLRARMLSALLSGEHEIPASYDALMEVAA